MHRQSGITLIELMMAVGIIGAIAAIAIPYYQSNISSSREAMLVTGIQSIRTFQEDRRLADGEYVEGTWVAGNAGASNLDERLGWSARSTDDSIGYVILCTTDSVAANQGTTGECAVGSSYKITATHSDGGSLCMVISSAANSSRTNC